MSHPTVDQVVEVMLTLRDRRSALKAEYEEADAKLKEKFQKGELFLKRHLLETKQDSFTAGGATVYTSTAMKASAADKDAFVEYLRENPAHIELLQLRLSNPVLKEYIEAHDGDLPPGVSVSHEINVNIRRKAAKKK